ncbi:hypothetical protein E6W93_22385 [Salmonella enterica subsp. enterica serovar Uppsala]|nr:hypothetical protein [Salmonella enterica subsp. enterica serovar Uppsala]
MKQMAIVIAAVILAPVLLVGCSHTTYTEATRADGSTVKHIAIAPGTKITTASGGCIDSTGAVTTCPTP